MRRIMLRLFVIVSLCWTAESALSETCICDMHMDLNMNGNSVTNLRDKIVTLTDTNDYTLTVVESGKTFVFDMAYSTNNSKEFPLPSVDETHLGLDYRFVNIASNFCLITPADADTINGSDAVAGFSSPVGVNYTVLKITLVTSNLWAVGENEGPWGPY